MKRALLVTFGLALASSAWAVLPGTDSYLVSVGHGQGQCPGGVCSEWRTTAWVFNPSTTQGATVQVSFLARDTANTSPPTQSLSLAPGATAELDDVILTLFGLDGAFGALRFTSDLPVVVTGRIYDANVETAKNNCTAVGTAGQFFAGQPAGAAIGNNEFVDLPGLAQDGSGVWRSNFGFVETTGNACTVQATRLDSTGAALGNPQTYSVQARSQSQFSLTNVSGPLGVNQRLRIQVVDGTGKILAFGSLIDNTTGDPSTVEMAGAGHDGVYVAKQDKSAGSGGYDTPITFTVSGDAVASVDATIVFTDEDVPSCSGGELLRLSGPLPQPVIVGDDGGVSFVLSGTTPDGVAATLQVNGTIAATGTLSGTVTTTLSGAGSCSGTKNWPLVGARQQ